MAKISEFTIKKAIIAIEARRAKHPGSTAPEARRRSQTPKDQEGPGQAVCRIPAERRIGHAQSRCLGRAARHPTRAARRQVPYGRRPALAQEGHALFERDGPVQDARGGQRRHQFRFNRETVSDLGNAAEQHPLGFAIR